MIYNALAGVAVGYALGMNNEEIARGIEKLVPIAGRNNLIEAKHYTIIDDCYNANPVSMKASLGVLQDGLGRKIAIIGDMKELGEHEAQLHYEVGEYASALNIDGILCVGSLMKNLAKAVEKTNPNMYIIHMDTLDELLTQLPELTKKGDTLLVKASHSMNFAEIVKVLQNK